MSCNFVTSDFNTCTLHRAIEECFSSFTDSPAGLRQPSRFHLSLAPGIFCYWSFYLWGFWYAPWRGIVWLPSRSLEDEGKRGWEDTREPALFISLLSQGEGRGSPWGEKARTFYDPFCPRAHWAFSLLTSPGNIWVARTGGSTEGEGLISKCTWLAIYFAEYLHLPAQWDWQKNNTFDMLFYLSTFCHDILWCKFLILPRLSAALAVTAQGQQWG